MITLNDYITASGKYPERLKSSELTDEVKKNAQKLLDKVNALLKDLNLKDIKVSSGFRPSAVNANIKGAAKKSNHLSGNALDLLDPKNKLDELFMNNLKLLEKHGLYLEHPSKTNTWSHLQQVPPASGNRVFMP